MAWDKNKPAGSQKLRLSDDEIRENQAAIEAAFGEGHDFSTGGTQTGKHVAPTFQNLSSDPAVPASGELKLYNKNGRAYWIDGGGNIRKADVIEHDIIPSGTKMLFKQSSAPSGWTFVAEDNDRVLLHTSTKSQGGATGGSWTISGFSYTVQGHALTINEIPSHQHYTPWGESWGGPWGDAGPASHAGSGETDYDNRYWKTSPTGGGAAHSHGFTASHNGAWRPAYVKVITCQKD